MRAIKLFIIAAALAGACKSPPPAPPAGTKRFAAAQTISANYDPSASGLPGSVGDVVAVAGGATAWVKYGSGVTEWRAFPGTASTGTGAISARVVAASNITLSGEQTIDGVGAVAGDRVLAAGQSTGSQNGLYTVASGAWTRTTDFDASTEMIAGTLVPVYAGTSYGGSVWQFKTAGTITVGSTSLTFSQVSPPSFGADTSVPMANGSGNNVTALHLVTSLTDSTAASEDSEWRLSTLVNGTSTEHLRLGANAVYTSDFLGFLSDVATGTGFSRPAVGQIWVYTTGTRRAIFSSAGLNLSFPLTIGANAQAGLSLSGSNLLVKPETAAGNVELGHVAGALATNATHGFVTLPTAAGTSTGTPAGVTAGQAACVINTSGNKLECYYGGAWHVLSP